VSKRLRAETPSEHAFKHSKSGGAKPLARKRFGQHFLVDRAIINAICAAIEPQDGQVIVEIGPGPGALTGALLERIERLHAVEIDRDLAALLRREYSSERLDLHLGDALSFDFLSFLPGANLVLAPVSQAKMKLRLVGNLPYNISSPLLIRLLSLCEHVSDMHFMLQKEVVERIAASPGTSAFGRLTVMLAACFDATQLFDVPPSAFDPPPRVNSAVVRLITKPPEARLDPLVMTTLESMLGRAFAQKRKMLRSAFIPWLDAQGVDASMITGTDRAEDIPAEIYFQLAESLRSINSIL
jgi:16S rRNA (adenine1518-N6/adenine1519-N6)-dimethyltransferase